MDELFNYLDYEFSFLLAIYLLVRMEKKLELLTESIAKLTNQFEKD
ncbi:YvrJ family protein [Kurthia gibsonii]